MMEQAGRKIQQLLQTPGHIRKDVIVSKGMVGRLIGSGGSTYKELTMKTSAKIFVLDKEGPPPGYGDDERMVTLVGFDSQVAHAEVEISTIVQSAMNRPASVSGTPRGPGFKGIGPQSWNAAPPPSYPQPYVDLAEQSGRGVKRSLD